MLTQGVLVTAKTSNTSVLAPIIMYRATCVVILTAMLKRSCSNIVTKPTSLELRKKSLRWQLMAVA